MRAFIHDYGRYAFTLDLARELSRRGHDVAYSYSELDSNRSNTDQDSNSRLRLIPIRGGDKLSKDSLFKRFQAEVKHGVLTAEAIREFKPDVILSGNTPLEAQWRMMAAARSVDAAFIYWLQDILSTAARQILPKKLPIVGSLVASHFERLETKMVRDSRGVVAIAPAFRDILHGWGVADDRITVIENWAPVLSDADSEAVEQWKAKHGLTGKRLLLYSGTLGMKHKPELLLELASRFRDQESVALVVIAEGPGMDWLKANTDSATNPNLVPLPFQPFSMLPVTLSAADVLIVLLEADAGQFCVPSKTLTYMRAGRPILGAMPASNLASQIVTENQMGYVVPPDDSEAFVQKGMELIRDRTAAIAMGANARAYADRVFNLDRTTSRFESLMQALAHRGGKASVRAVAASD